MKAFLSHSSKDKYFVRQVADALGTTQIEYDERTFEFTLNVQAIRRALMRSDLFVAFLSSNSITSDFVAEEERAALEARGRGNLEKVMIFAIDNTSYRELPDWLREINVIQQLSSPKACARRIQSALIGLDAAKNQSEPYLGREEDEKSLRRAVSAPPQETPRAIHAVGHHGIGRRTFLRKSLTSLYPRVFEVFPEVTLGGYAGIEDFFRSIYHLHVVVSSLSQTIADLEAFANKDYSGKLSQIGSSELGRALIDAGIGRMSALGANRTRRDGGNDVNDPSRPFGDLAALAAVQ
jgi:hypothetical protein